MSEVAAIITAAVGALTAVGAAGRFVWNKIEARFQSVEAELVHCREREAASAERRGTQLTVIELLWQEVQRHNPGSVVLTRVKNLLDDLKQKEREGA